MGDWHGGQGDGPLTHLDKHELFSIKHSTSTRHQGLGGHVLDILELVPNV